MGSTEKWTPNSRDSTGTGPTDAVALEDSNGVLSLIPFDHRLGERDSSSRASASGMFLRPKPMRK